MSVKFPKGSLFGVQFCFVCLDDQFDCLAVGLALQNAARINSNLIGCGNRSRFASIAMRCFSLTLKSAENSNNIIQKALAFLRNRSSTAFNSERKMRGRDVKTTAPPNDVVLVSISPTENAKTSVPLSATSAAESAPALATKKSNAGLLLGLAEELQATGPVATARL